jgi:hypothetical protein
LLLHLITLSDTYTYGTTTLHERSANRKAIRTRYPSQRAAADPRLRPFGSAVVFMVGLVMYFTISGYVWVRTQNIVDNTEVRFLTL